MPGRNHNSVSGLTADGELRDYRLCSYRYPGFVLIIRCRGVSVIRPMQ